MIRPRRSLLFMPGSNARALEKARILPADGIILDLEDSVAPDAKALARDQIAQAIAARGFGKREILIRVNASIRHGGSTTSRWPARPGPTASWFRRFPASTISAQIDASPGRCRRRPIDQGLGDDRDRARGAACRGARRRLARSRDAACRIRVRAERYLAGDADQDAARPRGDDPDDHPLHPGDARVRARNSRRALQRLQQCRRLCAGMRARRAISVSTARR